MHSRHVASLSRHNRAQVKHMFPLRHLCRFLAFAKLVPTWLERLRGGMKDRRIRRFCQLALVVCLIAISGTPVFSGVRNWAVVASSGSKLQEVPLADLVKYCKGSQKAWPDGKNFTLVMHDPESAEMRNAIQKLFGVSATEMKPLVAKINEARPVIKIVDSDEDLLRTVSATPGAVGLVDVYSINSSVKVLRVDGKLPFDPGYTLKAN